MTLEPNNEAERVEAMGLGEKLSLLTHLLKLSQGDLAARCGISRISVNRFFKGRSELRAGDFVNLLEHLGVEVKDLIDRRIAERLNGKLYVVQSPQELPSNN